jgi:hypothetical protein
MGLFDALNLTRTSGIKDVARQHIIDLAIEVDYADDENRYVFDPYHWKIDGSVACCYIPTERGYARIEMPLSVFAGKKKSKGDKKWECLI